MTYRILLIDRDGKLHFIVGDEGQQFPGFVVMSRMVIGKVSPGAIEGKWL